MILNNYIFETAFLTLIFSVEFHCHDMRVGPQLGPTFEVILGPSACAGGLREYYFFPQQFV